MAGTPNVGTLVGAAIRPINTADLISTAYANEIKGGIHGYATILERDSIIIQRRQWGMLCTVYDDPNPLNNKTYQLKYNNFDTDLMNLLNWVEYTGVSTTSVTEWQNSVKSILTTVPTSPSDKDRYLVGIDQSSTIFGSPWAGNPGGFISEYDATTTNWTNTYPTNGMTIRVDDQDNSLYKYEGTYSTGKWDKEKLTQVYSTDFTGNGINYTTTTTPGFISYDIDTIFLSKFDVTNTGTIVKLDINGIGLLDVKKPSINGLVDLYPGEIQPDNIYSLVYDQDNNCFQFFKNYSSDSINIKYYIEPTDYIVVPPFCQYWIYGDLTVDGTIVNYGKIIVANGQLIIGTSGSVENFGEVDLITIGSGNTVDFSAIDGHLIPSTGDTYDIGATAGYNWRDLYLSGNTIHLGDSIISSSNGYVLFNGNTVSTTQSLQSITDNGNTTSNEINANGGIQGSTDYSSYAIGTSYYNDMKQVSLQVYGDGADFPVNSGCRLYMNPEEGLTLQRFYENSQSNLQFGQDTIYLYSSTLDGNSSLKVSPNQLHYNVAFGGEDATLYFNHGEGLAFSTNTINQFVGKLKSDFLTDDRTLQVPDNSGTIALLSDIVVGDFIPLTGTTASFVSGDIEFEILTGLKRIDGDITKRVWFNDDGWIALNNYNNVNGDYSSVDVANGSIYLNVESSNVFNSLSIESDGLYSRKPVKLYDPEYSDFGSVEFNDNQFIVKGSDGVGQLMNFGVGAIQNRNANGRAGTIYFTNITTTNKNYFLPNNSGTIALTSDISTATASLYNSIIKQTVTNGVTSSTPSQDAVYDFVTSTVTSATTENFSHYIFNMSNFIIEYGVSTFEIGKCYQIPSVEIGDDFTNIGYVDREPFIATGITPSSFLNGTYVNNINPLLTYKVYKNSNAISFDKIFDIDNNLMIALNITNPTSSILSSLLIEGSTSNTAGKSVYYDTDINKLIIAGYDTNIDLKVFNIEINSTTYSLV